MIGARPSGRHGAVVVGLGLLGAAISTVGRAGAGGGPGDDRAAAEALVAPLDKVDKAEPAPVTAEAVARTREALEQATRFRAAGDEAHAKAADGLAREWAETARDLALAAAAEKQAEDRKRQAIQAQAQLERTRALVEDGIARLGRIRAELDAAPAKAVTAVEVHDGQPRPPTAAKGPAGGGRPAGASTGPTGKGGATGAPSAAASGSPGGSTP